MQATLIQAIVLRYFEQTYGNDVTIYGEIANDIDIFSKQVKYLNGDICVFLTNLKDENIETPKNFCIKNMRTRTMMKEPISYMHTQKRNLIKIIRIYIGQMIFVCIRQWT